MLRPPALPPQLRSGLTALADWSVWRWAALAVMLTGLLMVVSSPVLGGRFYHWGVTPLVELLGAPEGREFLHPQNTGAGTELLVLLGGCNLAAGLCMICTLLVLELLGLAGAPALTGGMSPRGKLALGTAAAGLAAFVAAALPLALLAVLFVDHEHEVQGVSGTLGAISQAGGLLMVCAAVTFYLGGRRGRGVLLRWTAVAGWGRVRRGWLNTLALALMAGGLTGDLLSFVLPFDEVAGTFFTAGLTVLALGGVAHVLAIVRP